MLAIVDVTWQSVLVAYGPLGVMAVLYVRNSESRVRDAKDNCEAHKLRADRFENELIEQTRVLRDQVLANLTDATRAATHAVARRAERGDR